jgi:PleD family two-component response regulator
MDKSEQHILVIEDNEMNRELLVRRLEKEGYHITKAEDGYLGLGMLDVKKFDLVMLDLLMPNIDGFEVLDKMKAHPEWKNIPVIVVTSINDVDTAAECLKKGAADYLTKPLHSVILLARVESTLEKKYLRDREIELVQQLQEQNKHLEKLAEYYRNKNSAL